MPRGSEKTPLTERAELDTGCFQTHIVTITRISGILVAVALWAATVMVIKEDYKVPNYVQYYLIATSVVVTIFELTWLLEKCACCRREGCCCGCCLPFIMWVDGWKKFLLYAALSVLIFIQTPNGAFLAVCGFLLLVLAILYLLKSCHCRCVRVTRSENRTTVTETRHQETSTTMTHNGPPHQQGSRLVTITTRRSQVSEETDDKADAGSGSGTVAKPTSPSSSSSIVQSRAVVLDPSP